MRVNGNVFIDVRDAATGKRVRPVERVSNTVVRSGRRALGRMLLGGGCGIRYCGFGQGLLPPYVDEVKDDDEELADEVWRVAVPNARPRPGVLEVKARLGETDANGYTLREVALFDGANVVGTWDDPATTQIEGVPVWGGRWDVPFTLVPGAQPLHGGNLWARALITPIDKDENLLVLVYWLLAFYAE